MICPLCSREDAVRCKDAPGFYQDGRLLARCFHANGHPNQGPINFFVDTGEVVTRLTLPDAQSLFHVAQAGAARNFGGAFLSEKCAIYLITPEDVALSSSPVPTEKWMRGWDGTPITVAPLYVGTDLVGLEVRAMAEKAAPRPGESAPKTQEARKIVGTAGIYVANPRCQPTAVIAFEGIWDAVSAAWDALQNGSDGRYAFAAYTAATNANVLRDTLETMFPGVPRLIVSDQDPAGQGARKKLAHAGTLAILPGTGLAKDYRDAAPAKRWPALLDGIERALDLGNPKAHREAGIWKIAARAIKGTLQGKTLGMRDLEAWRFGQRCAGICKATPGGRKFFSIRANLYGQLVTAEGQHDFEPIMLHRAFQDLERDHPDLAAVVRAGATEHPLSPQWRPPMFLQDGRHWSEVPPTKRMGYARDHGWEPWGGKDPGTFLETDLESVVDRMRSAYLFVRIPNAPDSEVGLRMTIWCLAAALCALRAEELWGAGLPTGFLPWLWFYGGPATGKGMAMKIIAAALTGDLRTFGSQRFGGDKEYDWLTESVLHLPVCFRDELDGFMKSGNIEDLKTFLAGEALQLRKKFGTDMSVAPRPVVIASNSLHISQDDEATQERITLVELQPNTMATKKDRNNAFEAFHGWLEVEGRDMLYRLCLALYKEFRVTPITRSQYGRSAMLDAAVVFLARKLQVDAGEIFRPSTANKEESILRSSPWFARLLEYANHEIGTQDQASARAVDVWNLNLGDPNQRRNFYRWIGNFSKASDQGGGWVMVGAFNVRLNPFHSNASTRTFTFSRGGIHAMAQ